MPQAAAFVKRLPRFVRAERRAEELYIESEAPDGTDGT